MKKYLTYFLITILVFIGIFYIFFNNKFLEGYEDDEAYIENVELQEAQAREDQRLDPGELEDKAAYQRQQAEWQRAEAEEAADGALISETETSDDNDYQQQQAQVQQDQRLDPGELDDRATYQRQQAERQRAEAAARAAERAEHGVVLTQEEAHGPNRSGNISYDAIRNLWVQASTAEDKNIAYQEKIKWDDAAADAKVNVGDGQVVHAVTVNGETKWKCKDDSLCYPGEIPLFKCLPKRDIDFESKIYNLHRCKDTEKVYDTGYEASYDLKLTNNEPGFRCRDRKNIKDCEYAAYTCIDSSYTANINNWNRNGWVRGDLDRTKYEGCDGMSIDFFNIIPFFT